jgi:membrane protease YdiL (CAAX protease family)
MDDNRPIAAIDKSLDAGITPDIGVTIVLSYVALHMVWGHLIVGNYVFVVERVGFLTVVLLYLTIIRRIPMHESIGYFHLPEREHWRLFIGLLAAVIIVRLAIKAESQLEIIGADTEVLTVKAFIDECVIPPLNEETMFRGLLLSCLISVFSERRWLLIVLSAVIFAACHNAPLHTLIAIMISGILYAIAFLKTKSLSGCMLLHAVWNFGVFVGLPAI